MMYETCPKCQHTTKHNPDHTTTCTNCQYTWAPIDTQLQDIAIQTATTNQALTNTQDAIQQILQDIQTIQNHLHYHDLTLEKITQKITNNKP